MDVGAIQGLCRILPFPLFPDWDAADSPWHDACEHVPPRVDFKPVRVERLLEAATLRYPDRFAARTTSGLRGRISNFTTACAWLPEV